MTRASGSNRTASAAWKVVLIVEDQTDGVVLQALAKHLCPTIHVDPLPAGGCGEIKRRLPALVRTAKSSAGKLGCVAVIVDADNKDTDRDEPHRSIQQGCTQLGIPFLLCSQSMEAWLLTDPGCREFLQLPTQRQRTDGLVDPKKYISGAYFKRTGQSYEKRMARQRLAQKICDPQPGANQSFKQAMECLAACPKSHTK